MRISAYPYGYADIPISIADMRIRICGCGYADADTNFLQSYFYWTISALFYPHIRTDARVPPDLPVPYPCLADIGIESRNTLPTQRGPPTNRLRRFQKCYLFFVISSSKRVMIFQNWCKNPLSFRPYNSILSQRMNTQPAVSEPEIHGESDECVSSRILVVDTIGTIRIL